MAQEQRVDALVGGQEMSQAYRPEAKRILAQQLKAMLARFPTLSDLSAEAFVFNDGTERLLLCARGTLPILHSGNTYHIPVALYLPPGFPQAAPFVYVEPVHGMTVASHSCEYVDANGLVYTPALSSWHASQSSLEMAAIEMAQLFGSQPPVFSHSPQDGCTKPETSAAAHPRMPHQHSYSTSAMLSTSDAALGHSAVHNAHNMHHSFSNGALSSNGWPLNHSAGTSNQGNAVHVPDDRVSDMSSVETHTVSGRMHKHMQARMPHGATHRRDPGYEFRTAALQSLNRRLRQRIVAGERAIRTKYSTSDGEKLLKEQQELQRRNDALKEELEQAKQEQEATEVLSSSAEDACKRLLAWLVTNETDAHDEVDGTKAIQPANQTVSQRIEAEAKVNANEDAIRAMDRCLREGSVPLQRYVTNIQALAREQFHAKEALHRLSNQA